MTHKDYRQYKEFHLPFTASVESKSKKLLNFVLHHMHHKHFTYKHRPKVN